MSLLDELTLTFSNFYSLCIALMSAYQKEKTWLTCVTLVHVASLFYMVCVAD